ncbi:TetR/AcrR family transcriptional regulator [Cryobacterium sp. 10C3]|uniref:TetR/AcrR family transcriptional regulator n=1 Tax=Cryobacterium sp. 10C3 TaxID=3048577 RepID=UPI003A0FF201
MTELEKGPRGLRSGRGARERLLSASQQLFPDQGINCTGVDQLCAVAGVSKRTLYQHFDGKDELIAEYLRRFDPDILPEVFDRSDLTPRERLLAIFDIHSPCARSSELPSKSRTRAIQHASSPAPIKRASPPGSLIPPARAAPPTPNSSASNWHCSWTVPRLAAESSTPTRLPPRPPSPSSSSTTPSPRRRPKHRSSSTHDSPSFGVTGGNAPQDTGMETRVSWQ